jgi:hypothetical protein
VKRTDEQLLEMLHLRTHSLYTGEGGTVLEVCEDLEDLVDD